MKYKMNLLGIPMMVLSIATLAGAFNGTDFERGVAGFIIMAASETFAFTLETEGRQKAWLGAFMTVVLALGISIVLWSLYLILTGLTPPAPPCCPS